MPDAPIERIRQHLVGLRMPRALETLDHLVQQIERGQLGTLEAIELLLAEEITIRESRRIKAALQMARLAAVKTLWRSEPASKRRGLSVAAFEPKHGGIVVAAMGGASLACLGVPE